MLFDVAGNTVPVGDSENVVCTYQTQIQKATGITLNKTDILLYTSVKDTNFNLSVTKIEPSDADVKTVTWSSNKPSVATVDASTGKVTAVSSGECTITATATDGGTTGSNPVTATCKVTVKPYYPTEITLSATEWNTVRRSSDINSDKINVTFKPSDVIAEHKGITWTTSNSAVATVSNGVITAKGGGTCTITATPNTTTGGATAKTLSVTVDQKVTGINITDTTKDLLSGTTTLIANVSPASATDKTINWTSSNTNAITVGNSTESGNKITLTYKAKGTAMITATSVDGNYTDTCKINPVLTFAYKGAGEEASLAKGTYTMQCWGAQGGSSTEVAGGLGAYVSGVINLTSTQKVYVYVGEQGNTDYTYYADKMVDPSGRVSWPYATYLSKSTFNNGTTGLEYRDLNEFATAGGGATDIRLTFGTWNNISSLRSRIIVAAGGGGGSNLKNDSLVNSSVPGGGLTGYNGNCVNGTAYGGSQTSGGTKGGGDWSTTATDGGFGTGGQGTFRGPSGGSGYYGGGAGGHGDGWVGQAASGSSFISGHNGCNAINEDGTHRNNATHYSGLVFTNTVMIDGAGYRWTNTRAVTATNDMPKPTGTGNQTGNIGNGYAKISW